jgi:hypothetical protein
MLALPFRHHVPHAPWDSFWLRTVAHAKNHPCHRFLAAERKTKFRKVSTILIDDPSVLTRQVVRFLDLRRI